MCRAKAWTASNKLKVLWKSNLRRDLRIQLNLLNLLIVRAGRLNIGHCVGKTTWWLLHKAPTCCPERRLERSYNYLTKSSTETCHQFQQLSRYAGYSLLEKQELDCSTTTSLGTKTRQTFKGEAQPQSSLTTGLTR